MQQVFNLRAGCTREDDTLPPCLLKEPLTGGAPKGRIRERESLLDEYYSIRGWNRKGRPMPERLSDLGIEPEAPPLP